jgi:hypothetical protein
VILLLGTLGALRLYQFDAITEGASCVLLRTHGGPAKLLPARLL